MATLYRDYRPQNFSEILGQNHIKITLQNEVAGGKIAQAYLFCGPRAVGKTTLARVLAKAVNCEKRRSGEYEPCNACPSCLSIIAGKNLDVLEIDAASNTGVDNVRDNIIASSRLAPASTKYKVFIIDEVHMLSLSAFNALLKIIEEPPAHVIFILCTTEVHKVPATIVSRCERFDFKRISIVEIVKKLTFIAAQEKVAIDKEVLEAVALRSGGHLRDAESLLGQIFSLGDKQISLAQAELVIPHYNSHEAVDLLAYLRRKDAAKAVALVNNLAESGVNIKNFTGEVISLLRQIILNKLSPSLAQNLGLDWGENLEMRLSEIAAELNWEQLFSFTRRFLETYNDNKNPLIAQLPLELAIGELCFSVQKMYTDSLEDSSLKPAPSSRTFFSPMAKNRPAAKAKEAPGAEKTPPPGAPINFSHEEILGKWPEFLLRLKKYNHSLAFVLQNCRPQMIKDSRLYLLFKYKFHQDRLHDPSLKNLVETAISEVFGSPLVLVSSLDENLEIRQEEKNSAATASQATTAAASGAEEKKPEKDGLNDDGLMNKLLETFGGRIIN